MLVFHVNCFTARERFPCGHEACVGISQKGKRIMVEANDASQFTSNYISTTSRSALVAAARGPSRNPPSRSPSPSIPASIDSSTHVIPGLCDVPSGRSTNLPSNLSPTDLEHQPIFKWNALCIQALLCPIAVLIYLLIGAAVFTAIERDHEKMARHIAANEEMHSVKELEQAIESVLRKFNLSENISTEILSNFTSLCAGYSESQNTPPRWEFFPAFYFSAIVITTIGEV